MTNRIPRFDADHDGVIDSDRVEQGSGSGLDADSVDGYHGPDLGKLDEAETVTGPWEFEDLRGGYPGRVRAVANNRVVASIDPEDTPTPVQDALDAQERWDGRTPVTVLLPPTTVEEEAPITVQSADRIVGWGPGDPVTEPASRIYFPNSGHDLVRFDSRHEKRYCALANLELAGNGRDTGVGIRFGDETASRSRNAFVKELSIENVAIRDLTRQAIRAEPGAGPVQHRWDGLSIFDVDPAATGSTNKVIDFEDANGYTNTIGLLSCYPSGAVSGQDHDVINMQTQGAWDIRVLNVGGATNHAINSAFGDGAVNVGVVNMEYTGQRSTGGPGLRKYGDHLLSVDQVLVRNCVLSRAAFIGGRRCGNVRLGHIRVSPSATLVNRPVRVVADPTAPIVYDGVSDDVAVSVRGELTHPVSCLGDLTTVS